MQTTGGVSLTPSPPAGAPTHPAPKCTEARTSYLPPPAERDRSYPIRPSRNQFPVPNQSTEFKTLKQQDFPPDLLRRPDFERSRPARHKDSGRLLPVDCPTPQFTTQSRTDYQSQVHSVREVGCSKIVL
ncbi:hypothetical protein DUNSADRAFT_1477 [Dunaliella salina]|uniref:Encoded protein n=1 Tax=Dunaliella salina TaxID=3046 RepID=A0ABQ7FXF5_DUNSA|nr:hypothetical protein DUNSADRAFT_1477 [Dunaliella salina]|eukprot:KAF5827032.1 hypothetical protein DUNSADRAFT_1477 [Dunaliella salina]